MRMGSSAAAFPLHIGFAAKLRLGLQNSKSSRVRWQLKTTGRRAIAGPRHTRRAPWRCRTASLGEARESEGQSRYSCSALRLVIADAARLTRTRHMPWCRWTASPGRQVRAQVTHVPIGASIHR
ncbi:hypothetical protein BDA96_04G251200 [Sorghum bicolor]|uniref:Uncharacterized protein n=2 Tax=Sorghum bicolor TaxID=4558 RepID=A0A921UJS1_SORBI|nr:hypothetical protein BDA96_04G251200 [Sorghum bicolor]OQU85420.1 hypothetical protein SORBI_3004G235851 [Sorghum bicolor]